MLYTNASLPVTIQKYREAQINDPVCQPYCQSGWPTKEEIDPEVKPYWDSQEELTMGYYGEEVPLWCQKVHEGHQGIVRYQDCHNKS